VVKKDLKLPQFDVIFDGTTCKLMEAYYLQSFPEDDTLCTFSQKYATSCGCPKAPSFNTTMDDDIAGIPPDIGAGDIFDTSEFRSVQHFFGGSMKEEALRK
jgi:hypothetical protein